MKNLRAVHFLSDEWGQLTQAIDLSHQYREHWVSWQGGKTILTRFVALCIAPAPPPLFVGGAFFGPGITGLVDPFFIGGKNAPRVLWRSMSIVAISLGRALE